MFFSEDLLSSKKGSYVVSHQKRKGVVADLISLPPSFADLALSGISATDPFRVQADVRLAATLGPKTKRITRKQLTGVDLTRTCELIAEPPEPLALRLSGCLLVGVARSAFRTLFVTS